MWGDSNSAIWSYVSILYKKVFSFKLEWTVGDWRSAWTYRETWWLAGVAAGKERNGKQKWTTESRPNHMFQLKMVHNYAETTQKRGWGSVNRAKLTCMRVCVLLYFFITCRIISLVIASNTSNCLGLHSSFLFCFGKLHIQTNRVSSVPVVFHISDRLD